MPTGMQMQLAAQCLLCGEFETVDDELLHGLCVTCQPEHLVWCDSCGDPLSEVDGETFRQMQHAAHEQMRRYHQHTRLTWWQFNRPARVDDSDDTLCDECTYACEDCSTRYAYEENADECCPSSSDAIHGYGYKPYLWFHMMEDGDVVSVADHRAVASKLLFMGFEIEVEKAAEHVDEFMSDAGENPHDEAFIYLKYDGSLSESGVEFVTMPATLEAFTRQMPWRAFDNLRSNGARAWAYRSCGMHVHVSRSAFTPSHMWKFLRFHATNESHIASFAGRDSCSYASWSSSVMGEMRSKTASVVKGEHGYDRYCAVNMLNRHTVELRYFRSNIMPDGILRNAQFVDAMYNYTKQLTVRDVLASQLMFNCFVDWMEDKPQYSVAYAHAVSEMSDGE